MELDKIKNFLTMFPEIFTDGDEGKTLQTEIIGLEQFSHGESAYKIKSVPDENEVDHYINGGCVTRINFSFFIKTTVRDVNEGGNVDVGEKIKFYHNMGEWLKEIYKTTSYQEYYEKHKNQYVKDNLDFTNWIKLEMTKEPKVHEFSVGNDKVVFSSEFQLEFE